ncbi:Eukaryotic translation initiation factor 4E type 2 [Irineochytrium annulatum]|nr:Eukaryotic translation initiation factor 4E type 2 [Irineochytrium annulatum]
MDYTAAPELSRPAFVVRVTNNVNPITSKRRLSSDINYSPRPKLPPHPPLPKAGKIATAKNPILTLMPPEGDELGWSRFDLQRHSGSTIRRAIAKALPTTHQDRVLFAIVGRCLTPDAPRPLGGKTHPGYKDAEGTTATELVDWILGKAVEPPLGGRGRKRLDAGTALRFVVETANQVMEEERAGEKDGVDESLLRGMDWAGTPMKGKVVIPRHLRAGMFIRADTVYIPRTERRDSKSVSPKRKRDDSDYGSSFSDESPSAEPSNVTSHAHPQHPLAPKKRRKVKGQRVENGISNAYGTVMHRNPQTKLENYDSLIKRQASFASVEEFWGAYNVLRRPSDLPAISDVFLFKAGQRPTWEDNPAGGKWIVRLKKGLASRYWENLVIALISEQFDVGSEICGAVISIRHSEDILSVWNLNAGAGRVNLKIRDTMKRVLNLPPSCLMEYKAHSQAIEDKSSFRNTSLFL